MKSNSPFYAALPCHHACENLSADGSLPGPQQTALAAILLTHPCRTDLLLSLFVANECVTATLRATERGTGAAAPQLKSQALWLQAFVASVD